MCQTVRSLETAPLSLLYCLGRWETVSQCLRNHAVKSGQHRGNSKLPHAPVDFSRQCDAVLIPLFGKTLPESGEISHKKPGIVNRPGQILIHILLFHPKLQEGFPDHGFLPGQAQRQIYPAQSHQIQFLFPSLPIPERHGIRIGTIIQKISVLVRGMHDHFFKIYGKLPQRRKRQIRLPCNLFFADISEIPV